MYSAYIFLVVDGGYRAVDCDVKALRENIHDLTVTAGEDMLLPVELVVRIEVLDGQLIRVSCVVLPPLLVNDEIE